MKTRSRFTLNALAFVAFLFVAPASMADISISVEAQSDGNVDQAADEFGPAVEEAFGLASANLGGASAIVLPGDLCPSNCGMIGVSARAFLDIHAGRPRITGNTFASGAGSGASTTGRVTDTLQLSPPPAFFGVVDVSFHVLIGANLVATSAGGTIAGSELNVSISTAPGGVVQQPGDIFSYFASADDEPGTGYIEQFAATNYTGSGTIIPPVYQTIATVPVIVGPGLSNQLGFAFDAQFGGFASSPGSTQVTLAPTHIGITVSQGSYSSLNGYQYLPEPDAWAPALLAFVATARLRRRSR